MIQPTVLRLILQHETAWRVALPTLLLAGLVGCRSAAWHREKADKAVSRNLSAAQTAAFGREEPLSVETAEEQLRKRLFRDQALPTVFPVEATATTASNRAPAIITLTPETALQVAARNSREFQEAKETLFRAALDLDLEQAAFRSTFAAMFNGTYEQADTSGSETVRSAQASASPGATRRFRNGVEMSGSIAVDLAKLLTQESASSLGLMADAGISIPLLRGAGRDIAAEPLRQAERNLLYAVYSFERFKRAFAVRIISNYIGVLQAAQQIRNAEQNYKSLITATRRARRLADAGRLPEFQYDQAIQNELRARARWIQALDNLEQSMDRFTIQLGLPPDARIALDQHILSQLNESILASIATADAAAAAEVPPADVPVELVVPEPTPDDTLGMTDELAIATALENRLDLRIAAMEVDDARRRIQVAEDNLRAELTLFGSVQSGARRSASSAGEDDARLDNLNSRSLLTLNLPFNRTAERIAYRKSIITLAARERSAEAVEDQVKLDIRSAFRTLRIARENIRIQSEAVRLAERRVGSTDMLLQAGRAEIRDVLEAQEALINVQNALTDAVVSRRIAELEFQRDLDILDVSAEGRIREIILPGTPSPAQTRSHPGVN
jgi:outer membrane protein TolC